MTDLEYKVNEYREYKRLAEQAEQMRDSLRDEIITMMQGAPAVKQVVNDLTLYKMEDL